MNRGDTLTALIVMTPKVSGAEVLSSAFAGALSLPPPQLITNKTAKAIPVTNSVFFIDSSFLRLKVFSYNTDCIDA